MNLRVTRQMVQKTELQSTVHPPRQSSTTTTGTVTVKKIVPKDAHEVLVEYRQVLLGLKYTPAPHQKGAEVPSMPPATAKERYKTLVQLRRDWQALHCPGIQIEVSASDPSFALDLKFKTKLVETIDLYRAMLPDKPLQTQVR
jgi:hypothetical protein